MQLRTSELKTITKASASEREIEKERETKAELSLFECSWCHFQNGGANKREPACITLSFAPSSSPYGKRRQLARQHALLALSLHLTLPAAANQHRATCQAVQWHMRSAAELLLVQVMSINGSKNNSSSLFRPRSNTAAATATFCTSCSQLKCELGERKTRASVESPKEKQKTEYRTL